MSHQTASNHNHSHKCSCDHTEVKFCKACQTVWCKGCNQEWTAKTSWAWSYPYVSYQTGQHSYGIKGASGTFINNLQDTNNLSSTVAPTVCSHEN